MNTRTDSYQGYTNHVTWVVNLWLTNTESAYHSLQRIINEEALDDREKANGLASFVLDTCDFEKNQKLDNRGTNWGAGINSDLWKDEDILQTNWLEIIQDNKEL